MFRAVQFAVWFVLAAGATLFAEQADRKAEGQPSGVLPGIPRKGPGRTLGPRLTNPSSPASRLYRATPTERERALEKLPLRQQERIRRNLQWFDNLAKQDQAVVLKRAERYESMSREARQAFNQRFRDLAQLSPDRRQAVGAALRRLQTASDDERAKILASPQFRSRFSEEEVKLISDLSQVIPPAM
jgi:hypothetical protein